tara:strand:+ start:132 stop:512 length:381 start_codon:yes stop_codon:yes gene_type:complete
MFSDAEQEKDYDIKFYWSFYELNNSQIIVLKLIEYWKKGKFIDNDFDFSYGRDKLKNGQFTEYEFGNAKPDDANAMSEEFFDWFESLPPNHQVKDPTGPTLEEEKCIKAFFEKHIEKVTKTATIAI